jgi:hypothetical protein
MLERTYGTWRCYKAFRALPYSPQPIIGRVKAFVLALRCFDAWQYHCHFWTLVFVGPKLEKMSIWEALTVSKQPVKGLN